MTEQEAIDVLLQNVPKCCKMVGGTYQGGFDNWDCDMGQAIRIAVLALQDVQNYQKIGTVEECQEAREKQKPKKPKKVTNSGVRYTDEYVCPNCEQHFTGTGIAEYCYHCGQAIDWNENLGEMGDEQP